MFYWDYNASGFRKIAFLNLAQLLGKYLLTHPEIWIKLYKNPRHDSFSKKVHWGNCLIAKAIYHSLKAQVLKVKFKREDDGNIRKKTK